MNERLRLFGHLCELVLAALAGMFVFGALIDAAGSGGFLDDHAGAHAPVMAAEMALGVAAWMRLRGYDDATIGEVAGALFAPVVVLLVPYAFGLVSADALLVLLHVLLFVSMAAAVWRLRGEFAVARHRRTATA